MSKPVKMSDEEILANLRGGPDERRRALHSFFSNPDLMKWTLRYVRMHGGSEQDGKDVFSEAFIVFERQLRTGHFRGESALKTWFHSIVRWQWLVAQRKRRPEADLEQVNLPSSLPNPEKLLIRDERRVILEQFLVQIGERCKRLLGLFQLNYSMREIQELAGYASEQVAANQVHSCREKLKNAILQDHEGYAALKTNNNNER